MPIWKALTEHTVLTAIEQVISQPLGNLCLPRNSYINRVFEVEIKETKERLIVKFYRPNRWTLQMIQNEHTLLNTLVESELPVIAPLSFKLQTLFTYEGIPFALFPKKGGRVVDELDQDQWIEVGRLLSRVHSVSKTITDKHRPIWTPAHVTKQHIETLLPVIPADYLPIFKQKTEQFIQQSVSLFKEAELFLIHGDCHFGNIIYRPDEHFYLVDFDDCCVGPAVQDLWMLLPGTEDECKQEITWFIEGYETFNNFPRHQLALLPALRLMRQLHFAAWCALQVNETRFKQTFPDWGTLRYWNELIKAF